MSIDMGLAFFLVIPTKKWLLDRNLIKQGFLKGFSGNTQGTGCGQSIDHGRLQTLTVPILRVKQAF